LQGLNPKKIIDMDENFISYIIIGIVVFVATFFLFRAVIIWYYKIDKRLEAAIKTNELLTKLLIHYGVIVPVEQKTFKVMIKKTGEVISADTETWEEMKNANGEDKYEILE
jgi:hypothetical protein